MGIKNFKPITPGLRYKSVLDFSELTTDKPYKPLTRGMKKRAGRKNKHHILPRKRGGKTCAKNIIVLDENRHSAYHLLFGNRTFLEAAALLKRTNEYMRRKK